MTLFSIIKESVFQSVHCDSEEPLTVAVVEAAEEEEEEEEEEAEDQMPAIQEACGETPACLPFKKHLEECAARVENGSDENCVEEFFHLQHCVDGCAAPKIFATLK
ncbi:ubiquinol--cytochrome-c reductase subunit 6 [Dispira parvispora]|uniref:Ubiquinol--cytochrome-c reductase subunit 6 n=1 Tax=Dispira parvispora TaxID=1520584 RepID=A0A9W8AHW2_9FUNG|nr:ubiquinol--cytochrome-c reductase subunit 6 [Dispira parvispora]